MSRTAFHVDEADLSVAWAIAFAKLMKNDPGLLEQWHKVEGLLTSLRTTHGTHVAVLPSPSAQEAKKSATTTEVTEPTSAGATAGMRVKVTKDCITCGLCADTCPEVFGMGDEIAQVKVDQVPENLEEAALVAADECPTEAIVIENGVSLRISE